MLDLTLKRERYNSLYLRAEVKNLKVSLLRSYESAVMTARAHVTAARKCSTVSVL